MDYALFFGGEKTLLFRRGQGIVFNEPSLVALTDGKIIACGVEAALIEDTGNIAKKSVIRNFYINGIYDATAYLRYAVKKIGTIAECLVAIPSSLSQNALDDYRTAIFGAGITDAVFIPAVVANAYAHGYDMSHTEPCLSIVLEGNTADFGVISRGEVIDGGTLDNIDMFEEAKESLLASHVGINEYHGDRICAVNGAGDLLNDEKTVRNIIELN